MRWLFLLALAGCAPKPAVEVWAASSLTEVVAEIASRGGPVRLRFDATSTLARQIREGASADVFVSADPAWSVGGESYEWLSNRLVLVVRKDDDVDLRALDSLAIANEQVPAGKYARQALRREGIAVARTIYGQNVRDVLSKVSQGGARGGIVYATDAAVDPEVRVAYVFPRESHDRIVYTVHLLRPEGRAFFEALREPWAIEIAKRRGFE